MDRQPSYLTSYRWRASSWGSAPDSSNIGRMTGSGLAASRTDTPTWCHVRAIRATRQLLHAAGRVRQLANAGDARGGADAVGPVGRVARRAVGRRRQARPHGAGQLAVPARRAADERAIDDAA